MMNENSSMLHFKVQIEPKRLKEFLDWQARLHEATAGADGFISLEIFLEQPEQLSNWKLALRFISPDCCLHWQQSCNYKSLIQQLTPLLVKGTTVQFYESPFASGGIVENRVTELFVTEVQSNQEAAFRNWIAKIHSAEAKFPGFCGVYVQAPAQTAKSYRHWITFLQFDTQEHLENWLNSAERKEILKQSDSLIAYLENHRLISSYPGWFHPSSFSQELPPQQLPPLWKQAMLVLLVLYPIVMLEDLFLSPFLKELNFSFAMFIGNFLSVSLVTWPLMPLAIYLFKWWLYPSQKNFFLMNFLGIFLLILIYFLEIIFFT